MYGFGDCALAGVAWFSFSRVGGLLLEGLQSHCSLHNLSTHKFATRTYFKFNMKFVSLTVN
jgi:hypothetical protein